MEEVVACNFTQCDPCSSIGVINGNCGASMKFGQECNKRARILGFMILTLYMALVILMITRKNMNIYFTKDSIENRNYETTRSFETTTTTSSSLSSRHKEHKNYYISKEHGPLSNRRMYYVPYLTKIPFLIEEPDVCNTVRPNVSLLIYVHSAPDHFKNRAQIRQSYGNSALHHKLGTVVLFFMGRSKNKQVEEVTKLESQRYHDIVKADYYDTYHNLTFKAVSALTWITKHCSQVPYVLKTDDDIFLNIFNIVRHLKYLKKYQIDSLEKSYIHCKILYSTIPMRGTNDKWYVSEEDYPEAEFPLYCSGAAYFMPGFIVPVLRSVIPMVPFLWLDDVYVTGLLRNATGKVELNRISSAASISDLDYMKRKERINGDELFGHISGDKGLDLRLKFWNDLLNMENSLTE